jgi:hypothetical protein
MHFIFKLQRPKTSFSYLARPLAEEHKPKRDESEESVFVHEIAHHVPTPLIVPSSMKEKESAKESETKCEILQLGKKMKLNRQISLTLNSHTVKR